MAPPAPGKPHHPTPRQRGKPLLILGLGETTSTRQAPVLVGSPPLPAFDALRVADGGARRGWRPRAGVHAPSFSRKHRTRCCRNAHLRPLPAPNPDALEHRAFRPEAARQPRPLAAGAQQVEQGVDHFARAGRARPPATLGRRNQGVEQRPPGDRVGRLEGAPAAPRGVGATRSSTCCRSRPITGAASHPNINRPLRIGSKGIGGDAAQTAGKLGSDPDLFHLLANLTVKLEDWEASGTLNEVTKLVSISWMFSPGLSRSNLGPSKGSLSFVAFMPYPRLPNGRFVEALVLRLGG